MMYAKLALENVKKSTKDYLIYIVTLTACISMFYAFLSISSNYYDPNIGAEFNLDILGDGIKYAILLITVLLMFLMQVCKPLYDTTAKKGICNSEYYWNGAINDSSTFLCGITNNGNFFADCGDRIRWCVFSIHYCYAASNVS